MWAQNLSWVGPKSPRGPPPGVSEMSHSSFEQDEVDEAEVFGQAVAEDPVWVAMPDLVGGQAKVDDFTRYLV